MAAGGKIIGQVSIKVTPDTDGFYRKVREDLRKIPDEVEVGIEPDSDGLREKVKAATKEAGAGQKVEVDVEADKKRISDSISEATRAAKPENIQASVDRDRLAKSIAESVRKTDDIDLAINSDAFKRRIDNLLKPVELPVSLDDAGKSIDNELRNIKEFGALEIPAEIDTTGFSKEALKARAEASKVLDQNRARLRLEAEDSDLQNKLADARARVKEIQELNVSPKYDPAALQGFQRDLAKSVTRLDELNRRRSGLTELEVFDRDKLEIDLEFLQGKIEEVAKRAQAMQANPFTSENDLKQVMKQWADMTHQASRYQRKIDEINNRPLDPKLGDGIAREIQKIDQLEGRIADMRAKGSNQQYLKDLDEALVKVRQIESQLSRNNAAQTKIAPELDEAALNRALNVLKARTSEAAEDAHFRVNMDYGDLDRQLREALRGTRPNVRPDLDPNTQSELSRALQGMDLRVPANIDTSRFSQQALDMREVAQRVLDDARLVARLDADDRELTRKTTEARDRLQTLSDMRVDPEFGTRGLDRVNELIVKTQRDLERLNSQRVGPQMDPTLERQIDQTTNKLRTLQDVGKNMSREGVKYRIDADIDTALGKFRKLDADADRIAKKRRTINYDIDTGMIRSAMNVLTSSTEAAAKAASMGLGIAKNAMEGLGTATQDVGEQIMGVANRMQAFQTIQQWGMGLVMIFAQLLVILPAIGTAIALIGAAISAAFATIVTAVAGLIPLLGSLGIAAGVVALGVDGIKEAASTLKPEFEALKQVANETFETHMTPQLQRLKPLLENMKNPVHELAQVIGKDLTQAVVDAVVVFDQMVGIEDTIGNVTIALREMAPGVHQVTSAILTMVAQESGVRILTNAINELGTGWNEAVQQMVNDGSLEAAFTGLDEVVQALMRSLVSLVENGLRMFAAAAPGIQATVDAITGFFDRFDYEALGTAVGDVFNGIAEAIDRIPQSTIDSLTDSFQRMGVAFNSPEFQRGAQAIIEMATAIISYLPQLIGIFGAVASAAQGFAKVISGVFSNIGPAFQKFAQGDILGGLTELATGIFDARDQIGEGMAQIGQAAVDGANAASAGFANANLSGHAQNMVDSVTGVLSAGSQEIAVASRDMGAAMGVPPELNATLPPQWRGLGNGAGVAASGGLQEGTPLVQGAADVLGQSTAPPEGGLDAPWAAATQPIPGTVGTNLAPLPEAVQGPIDSTTSAIEGATANWQTVLDTAVTGINTSVADAFTRLGDTISLNVNNWSLSVDLAMIGVRDAIVNGFTTIQDTVTNSMTTVSDTIANGTIGWDQNIANAMTNIQNNITNGFNNISNSVNTSMQGIANAITTGANNWALSVDIAATNMANNLTNALSNMSNTASTSMQGISNAISTATQGWATSVQNAATSMSDAVTNAFNGIAQTITNQMQSATNAIRNGTQQWDDAVRTAGDNMSTAMTDSMNRITDAVTQGMQRATDAVRNAMEQMVNAVRDGGNQMVDAVTDAVNRAVAAAEDAVPRFRRAGENMGQALADGLNSKAGAVEAAAARLANAAAAATEAAAQINSPSRVFIKLGEFIGLGFAAGIEHSAKYAEKQGSKMVDLVVDTAERVHDAFEGTQLGKEFVSDLRSDIPKAVKSVRALASGEMRHSVESEGFGGGVRDDLVEALSGWAVQIDANGMARMVNKANTRKARR